MLKKTITAALAVALGATLAFAGHGQGHHGRGKGAILRFSEELNLSDAQKTQIKDMQQSFSEQNQTLMEQFKQTSRDYRDARRSGDTAKADSLKTVFESQKAQVQSLHKSLESQLMNILTAEQRAKYETLKAEHAQRRNEWKGKKGEWKENKQ
jgi:Spy/CpxP family protein refolding chaperone